MPETDPKTTNGAPGQTKEDAKAKAAELNEEDTRLKEEVELMVTRISDKDSGVCANALQMLSTMLRTATGTVGSVPKPLKFVRPFYDTLKNNLEERAQGEENRKALCNLISFIAMTKDSSQERECLKYRLLGSAADDIDVWGHEYIRHLAGELTQEWQSRTEQAEEREQQAGEDGEAKKAEDDTPTPSTTELKPLIERVMAYLMNHQDESAGCDLAIETENTPMIIPLCNDDNFNRVNQYVLGVTQYQQPPENLETLDVVYQIYKKFQDFAAALRIALLSRDSEKAQALFSETDDEVMKKQLAFMCARHRLFLEHEDTTLAEINGNVKISDYFLEVAKAHDSLAPRKAEDIYKTHLLDQRFQPSSGNSHIQNLATSFATAFANCGFTKDNAGDTYGTLVHQTKEHRMTSATAALGLIDLWNYNTGPNNMAAYEDSTDPHVMAGAVLGNGIVLSTIHDGSDMALVLLEEHANSTQTEVRVGALLGLGIALAGTRKTQVLDLIAPIVSDTAQPIEVRSIGAYALSLVFVGSCHEDVSDLLVTATMDISEVDAGLPVIRYLILSLGLIYLGSQERASAMVEFTSTLSPVIAQYADIVVRGCAYAGSGNVMQIQKMFALLVEQQEEEEDKPSSSGGGAGGTGGGASGGGGGEGDEAETVMQPEGNSSNDKKEEKQTLNHKAAAVLAIGLIALGESYGTAMVKRSLIHILMTEHIKKKKDPHSGRRAIPLAYALLTASTPDMQVLDSLHKLSHDSDKPTAMNAILAMGIAAAGTGNARVGTMLRNLSGYYHDKNDELFITRIAQGLCSLGKNQMTINPLTSDGLLISPAALGGLLGVFHSALDLQNTVLDKYHYMLFCLTPAISPRMLLTVDENLEIVNCPARIGIPVDTVTVPGKPKNITGFQTQTTPLLFNASDRAELTGKYSPATPVVENIVIVREKKDELE